MTSSALGLVGVLGDVHAEDVRLAMALDVFAKRKVGQILCVGDIADGEGDLERTIRLLRESGAVCVTGNHDRWWLDGTNRDVLGAQDAAAAGADARAWLTGLPTMARFDSPRGRLLLCHGLGKDDMAQVRPDDVGPALDHNTALQVLLEDRDVDIVVNGHSHRRMLRRVGRLVILNAGTLHRAYPGGFVVADLGAGQVDLYDFDDDGPQLGRTLAWPG